MMIKKVLGRILSLVFLVILGVSGWFWLTSPIKPKSQESQIFVIAQGWGVNQIAYKLKDAGLIRNPLVFQIIVFGEGLRDKLQAGDFRLSQAMSVWEISQTLTHGTLDVWVTIPEGLRKEEIAVIIKKAFVKQAAEFDQKEFINVTKNLEGYLFPDTYLVPKDASASAISEILQNTFADKYAALVGKTDLTQKQTVILASLIEREAKTDEDRKIVAGILLKRLKKGWPLQVDASSQYAKANLECPGDEQCKDWWPKIEPADLKVSSPHNLYENSGLPPSAICNPSLSSLQAATSPQDSDFWFYLSDREDKMHYAETLEEQDKNIAKFLN